jgi:anti-sigma regulatory factor (Ser/Thr protein kinase)
MTAAALTPVAAGPVRLRIPPDPALSRVLRMTVGAMASIGPFTLDEIDDVKIAVSEVLIALIEHGDQADIDVELDLAGSEFTIVGTTDGRDVDLSHPDLVLCRTVLDGVSDVHSISTSDGRMTIRTTVCADAA